MVSLCAFCDDRIIAGGGEAHGENKNSCVMPLVQGEGIGKECLEKRKVQNHLRGSDPAGRGNWANAPQRSSTTMISRKDAAKRAERCSLTSCSDKDGR